MGAADNGALDTTNTAVIDEFMARKLWALARIGHLVNRGREAGWLGGSPVDVPANADELLGSLARDVRTPMQHMASCLGLSTIELDILWVLACIELDPLLARVADLLAAPGMHELSMQIVEQIVAPAVLSVEPRVFDRLARFALIEMAHDQRVPFHRRTLRATDRVVDLARGHLALDRELAGVATLESALDVRRETSTWNIKIPPALAHAVAEHTDALLVATGIEGSGRAATLRHAVSSSGHAVLVVASGSLSCDADELQRQLRAIARECKLHDAWPLLRDLHVLGDRAHLVDRELLHVHPGPVLATSAEACTWRIARTVMTLPVALPDVTERAAAWRQALPTATEDLVRACAGAYTIAPALLKRTAAAAAAMARGTGRVEIGHVHEALRAQLDRRLVGLAHRIETRQTWDDLVLPIEQFDLLIELVARVKHRTHVLETWGFADKVGRGLGLSTLLSGPPGTGKTMIAGLLARELGLDLYQVDLSRIVSKYIGETEKQLSALFEAAEAGHAILHFDEADSLFAKRTDVKSSNDRYANLEVNYLLQRMEAFSGISILTTNHETAIDPAFMRRLAFHIRVPMPEEPQREMLWRTMMPARAECSRDLDLGELATQFVMSGGYIKNAVLRAAFIAADEGTAITNAHLWRAARAEYESMGKVTYQPAQL